MGGILTLVPMIKVPKARFRCAVCGREKETQRCWLKKVKTPTCSRTCNGKLRVLALAGHCGNMKGRKRKDRLLGKDNPSWNGGRYVEPGKGYVLVRDPSHHRARKNGYVLEHIVVAEEILGRRLKLGEEIHHSNHIRADNRPENLKVYDSHKQHWVEHHLGDVHRARDAAYSSRLMRGGARP
jgi:hypothetical protein